MIWGLTVGNHCYTITNVFSFAPLSIPISSDWHSWDFYSFGAGQRQYFLVTLFRKVLFQTSIQPWCVSKRYSMYMFVSLFFKFWLIDVHFECF